MHTSINPCVLGNPNPLNSMETFSIPQDILSIVNLMIDQGAHSQDNCPTNIGKELGDFVIQTIQAFVESLGAGS